MQVRLIFFLLSFVFATASELMAQQDNTVIHLTMGTTRQQLSFFPYKRITVIDARADSSYISIPSNGVYPAQRARFNEPIAKVFKDYIERQTVNTKKGELELLLRIEQFSSPNLLYTTRMSSDSVQQYFYWKNYLFFKVVAYAVVSDKGYEKVFSGEDLFFYASLDYFGKRITKLMDNLVVALSVPPTDRSQQVINHSPAQKGILNNVVYYAFNSDSSLYRFEEVQRNVQENWIEYEVVSNPRPVAGYFRTFDAFRNNTPTPSAVAVKFSDKDSLYKFKLHKHNERIWGICDGKDFYMRISDTSYLKLIKENNTFFFRVPNSLPDMHALLSIEEQYRAGDGPTVIYSNGAILSLVATIINTTIVRSSGKKTRKSKEAELIEKSQQFNLYRKCILNMDNGDIIF